MLQKILMLGGADIQVTAIQRAKELGYHVITCDNRPENPGHAYSDEYHEVSTTDLTSVLALARRLDIRGISAYASDPGAVTAAYVAEQLGLPGDPYRAVCAVQDKVEFRKLQHDLNMPAPEAMQVDSGAAIVDRAKKWRHGGIVKPVDASGSKGVTRVSAGVSLRKASTAYQDAFTFSRAGKVILEEFIPRKGRQMTGDALVIDGRIVFWCFGDVHFNDRINGLVPRGVTIPGSIPQQKVEEAMSDLQRLVDHIALKQGVYNIDLYLDRDDRPIVVDLGLRNGGNMLNTLYERRTGIDLMEISLRLCMGEKVQLSRKNEKMNCFIGHCVVHSLETGRLKNITFSDRLQSHTFYRSVSVKTGDPVHTFQNSGHRLGLLLLEFGTSREMLDVYANIYDHMIVSVETP